MIISRTPLRMSFVGGGTDLPSFYRQHTGAVVSTTIQKYVYVTINKKFDSKVRVSYSRTEEVEHSSQIEHPIVREVLLSLNIQGGIEITSISDVPSKGTGLGSSSAFTVGLANALSVYQGEFRSASNLGHYASQIEIDILKEPIGKQDQYASAFGGLNLIEFHPDETVTVKKLICTPESMSELEKSCLVFYTGSTRSASQVLAEQNVATQKNQETFVALKSMSELAYKMAEAIQSNQIANIGNLLHENWLLKRSLTNGISNSQIDIWYEKGLKAGATGGKLLGAGAGGFLLFFAPPQNHFAIEKELSELRKVNFPFEKQGSSIIFIH